MRTSNARMVAAMAIAGAWAAMRGTEPTEPPPSLTVRGDAEISIEPDLAVLRLGATAHASDAASAQVQVNATMQQVIAALRQAGVPEAGVQTTGTSVEPDSDRRTEPGDDPSPRIVAYRANNTVQIRVDDPTSIGEMIDVAIGAGANQVESISFERRDDTPERAETLRLAARRARLKAEALADGAGVRLLEVLHVVEGGESLFPAHRPVAFRADTPVEPGRIQVQASVTITYRIAPRDGMADGR